MNSASKTSMRQRLILLDDHSRGRREALHAGRKSGWKDAWIECLIQASAATPWIAVSAIGRLAFRPYL
jgi:hypothetical protein